MKDYPKEAPVREKGKFAGRGGKAYVAAAVITVAALGFSAYCGMQMWQYRQPKFQDVTMELGTDTLEIGQFLTDRADPSRASFTDSAAGVDLNQPGDHELFLRHGDKLESAVLHIVDTTAPEVEFIRERQEPAGYVPKPEDFVKKVKDFSDTTVSFEKEPVPTDDHADLELTVVVTDSSGNETRETCRLSFRWLLEEYTLELGTPLTRDDLLATPELDRERLSQDDIDRINVAGVGSYTVTAEDGSASCQVRVQDTQGPVLMLQPVRRKGSGELQARHFVHSVSDYSGKTTIRLLTEPDMQKKGYQTVTIEAEDIYGNVTRGETLLQITDDLIAPIIDSLPDMKVAVYSSPDYMVGASAWDRTDGYVPMTVDDSRVRLSEPGVYTAVYRATDAAGNTAVRERTIEVTGDAQDPTELVKQVAAELSDDPEEIRDYVRSEIAYSHEWGEGDTVVYGLTRKRGNCYVHAMCLKALFDEKGIENQLIWCTNKTHYWLLVKIGDDWRHIDPTPSDVHDRYSLMTDQQRLRTLGGRVWDTDSWPACE